MCEVSERSPASTSSQDDFFKRGIREETESLVTENLRAKDSGHSLLNLTKKPQKVVRAFLKNIVKASTFPRVFCI